MKPKKEQFDERKMKHSAPLNEDWDKSWEDQDECPKCKGEGWIGDLHTGKSCRQCHGLGLITVRSKR